MSVDVVISASPDGKKLAKLPVAVQRGAKMARTVDAAKGSLSIGATHPKLTDRNFRTGNIIFVKSSDYPTIPNFGAAIWNPDPNGTVLSNDGIFTFGLRAYEWVSLHNRLTSPNSKLTGSPGSQIKQVLQMALADSPFPLSTDFSGINTNGASSEIVTSLEPCYELINKIANDNDGYWWLDAVENSRNMIEFVPQFRYRRSVQTRRKLVVGGDVRRATLIPSNVYEFTEIANRITGVGYSDGENPPLTYTEDDNLSKARYQQIYHIRLDFPNITDLAALQKAVRAALKRRAFLKLAIDGFVTTGPYPRVGDVCKVDIGSLPAFLVNRHGSIINMQCDTTNYSPSTGMTVHLTELITL